MTEPDIGLAFAFFILPPFTARWETCASDQSALVRLLCASQEKPKNFDRFAVGCPRLKVSVRFGDSLRRLRFGLRSSASPRYALPLRFFDCFVSVKISLRQR